MTGARGRSGTRPALKSARRSAALPTRGRSGTPRPNEVARESASGGGGALGAAACCAGEGMPASCKGVRAWSGKAGLGVTDGGGTFGPALMAAVLAAGIDAAPTAVAPADTFTAGGRDGGVDGTADPNERRASAAADSVFTIATVSSAAPSPPAADNAKPADASAPADTPAPAARPNEASSEALAPTSTPAEIPIPPPADRLELKSIESPA